MTHAKTAPTVAAHTDTDTDADADRIPFHELYTYFGVQPGTVYKWCHTGELPAELLHDADRSDPDRVNYDAAWVMRSEAKHWAHVTGRFRPDGTPNRTYAATMARRTPRTNAA